MRLRFAALLGTVAWLAFGAIPSRAANGEVALNWNSCSGPVEGTAAGPGIYSLFVSVFGTNIPHKAYDVRVIYGDMNAEVPDAWRFDDAGCQGTNSLVIDERPAVADSKTCPAFMQDSSPALQVKDVQFVPPGTPYTHTMMRLVLENSYPNGVSTVDPLTQYHLARFVFDHTNSIVGPGTPGQTCGGLESSMCFQLITAVYLDMDGQEASFDRPFHLTATMNDPQQTTCAAIPARPTTWGQIKNQYRN